MRNKINKPGNKSINDFKVSKDPESRNFKNLLAFIVVVITLLTGVAGAALYFFAPSWSKVFNDLFGELWPLMTGIIGAYFGIDLLNNWKNANK